MNLEIFGAGQLDNNGGELIAQQNYYTVFDVALRRLGQTFKTNNQRDTSGEQIR